MICPECGSNNIEEDACSPECYRNGQGDEECETHYYWCNDCGCEWTVTFRTRKVVSIERHGKTLAFGG